MPNQQIKTGAILKVDLKDNYHTYARVLEKGQIAFYDLKTKKNINDLQEITSKTILFILAVYADIIKQGRWPKVGDLPLEENLQNLPMGRTP